MSDHVVCFDVQKGNIWSVQTPMKLITLMAARHLTLYYTALTQHCVKLHNTTSNYTTLYYNAPHFQTSFHHQNSYLKKSTDLDEVFMYSRSNQGRHLTLRRPFCHPGCKVIVFALELTQLHVQLLNVFLEFHQFHSAGSWLRITMITACLKVNAR